MASDRVTGLAVLRVGARLDVELSRRTRDQLVRLYADCARGGVREIELHWRAERQAVLLNIQAVR